MAVKKKKTATKAKTTKKATSQKTATTRKTARTGPSKGSVVARVPPEFIIP